MTLGIAPFLAAQLIVLALTIALPQLTHFVSSGGASAAPLSPDEVRRQLESIRPIIEPRD